MPPNNGSVLIFDNLWVDNISFKRNPLFAPSSGAMELETRYTVSHREMLPGKGKGALVSIICEIFNEDFSEIENPFYLTVTLTGAFTLSLENVPPEMDQKQQDQLLQVNTTAILFPYLRSLITNITANANVPPLILPPVNTYTLIQQQAAQTEDDQDS
ncbi:MAG: protein-export chaperone SecB [Bacilli bacterium]